MYICIYRRTLVKACAHLSREYAPNPRGHEVVTRVERVHDHAVVVLPSTADSVFITADGVCITADSAFITADSVFITADSVFILARPGQEVHSPLARERRKPHTLCVVTRRSRGANAPDDRGERSYTATPSRVKARAYGSSQTCLHLSFHSGPQTFNPEP